MMSTRAASTTALIIVMILSMLDAPCTSRRRRTSVAVVAPEIHYYCTAAEQPLFGDDLDCKTAACCSWYLFPLSSIGSGTASPPALTTSLPSKSYYSSNLLIPSIQDIQTPDFPFVLGCGRPGSEFNNISLIFMNMRDFACKFKNGSEFEFTGLTFKSMGDWSVCRKMLRPRYSRRNRLLSSNRSGTNKLGAGDDSISKENLPAPRRRRALDDDRKQQHEHHARARAIYVGLALLLGLVCTIAAIILLWCRRSKKLRGERPVVLTTDLSPFVLGPRRYSRRELATATHGFADENKIGQGGFGPVYRANLSDQKCQVAIKVLSQGQGRSSAAAQAQQGRREFEAEVKVMTRLRHRNIVKLLGWCDGPRDLLLVYEFMPNGSLDKHLFHPRRLLTWPQRYRIALDVGFGILYLHTGCEQCVVHGDIKPANIMLDQSCNAKLGDFGLARLLDHGAADSPPTTQVVAGTIGYIDPELVNCRRPSAQSDVYSFGVVLIEIACGKRPTTAAAAQPNNQQASAAHHLLLHWVRGMYVRDTVLEAADRRLNGQFDEGQMRRMLAAGLWCAHRDPSQRPSITQAMDALQREDDAELHVHLAGILTSALNNPSLQEGITCSPDLSEDSPAGAAGPNASAETAYYTSKDSARLIICS